MWLRSQSLSRSRRVVLTAALCAGAHGCSAGGGGDKLFASGAAGGGASANGSDGIAFGSSGAGNLDDRGPDGGCNSLDVGFEEINPTVVLLVDRSGSMFDQSYGSSPDRWNPLKSALVDPAGPISTLQSDVRWGLTTYTNNGDDATSECPLLTTVSIAFENYDAIRSEYDAISGRPTFKAETPTGVSLRAVTEDLARFDEPGPKFIILATDGEPDTCAHPDPQCGQDESIRAVQDAFRRGIETFVIGIGNELGEKHLRDIANAGAGLPVEPPGSDFINNCVNPGLTTMSAEYAEGAAGNATYYRPADQGALESDLRSIIGNVRKCSFELDAEVDLDRAFQGEVVLDGIELGYEDPDGWRMIDETELEVVGASCEQILSTSKRLSIQFPCDVAVRIR